MTGAVGIVAAAAGLVCLLAAVTLKAMMIGPGIGLAAGACSLALLAMLGFGAARLRPGSAKPIEWAAPAAPRETPKPVFRNAAAREPTGSVTRFLVERLAPAPGAEIEIAKIFGNYKRWCAGQNATPVTARAFADMIAKIIRQTGIATREDGDHVYCLDVNVGD